MANRAFLGLIAVAAAVFLLALSAFSVRETELAIIAALRDKLIADGMFLVGIDVIGSQVVEINAESPGGFQSVERLYDIDIAETVIEALEHRVSQGS